MARVNTGKAAQKKKADELEARILAAIANMPRNTKAERDAVAAKVGQMREAGQAGIDALTNYAKQPNVNVYDRPEAPYSDTTGQAPNPRGELGPVVPPTAPSAGQMQQGTPMRVQMPNGSMLTFNAINEDMNQALLAGGKPLDADGRPLPVSQFQGGWLVNGNVPLNVMMGQGYAPGQMDALIAAGLQDPPVETPPPSGAPPPAAPPPSAPPPIGAGGNPLPEGAQEMLDAQAQIAAGRTAGIDNLAAEGADFYRQLRGNVASDAARRDSLIDQFLNGTATKTVKVKLSDGTTQTFTDQAKADLAIRAGGKPLGADGRELGVREFQGGILVDGMPMNVLMGNGYQPGQREALQAAGLATPEGPRTAGQGFLPTIYDTISRQNTEEGLSPEAMAALRSEGTSGIQRQYGDAAQSMRTALQRRGMFGGEGGASGGDFVRGFAPLAAARADAYSSANRNVIMANEEAKKKSLLANREAAAEAVNQLIAATGTVGTIYNPNNYAQSATGALNSAGGLINAGTGSLNTSVSAAQGGADLEPGSFQNMLYAALFNNAGGIYDTVTGRAPGSSGSGVGGAINAGVDAATRIADWLRNRTTQTTNTNPSGNGFGFGF